MSHKRLYRALRQAKRRGHDHDLDRAYRLSLLAGWSHAAYAEWYFNIFTPDWTQA